MIFPIDGGRRRRRTLRSEEEGLKRIPQPGNQRNYKFHQVFETAAVTATATVAAVTALLMSPDVFSPRVESRKRASSGSFKASGRMSFRDGRSCQRQEVAVAKFGPEVATPSGHPFGVGRGGRKEGERRGTIKEVLNLYA